MAVTRFLHPNVQTAIHSDTDSENTAAAVEESPVMVHSIDADNASNGAASYVKFYDTLDTVVVGTTVPDHVFMIPASVRLVIESPDGLHFGAVCQVATVTAGGTGGTTSPTSSMILRLTYDPVEETE